MKKILRRTIMALLIFAGILLAYSARWTGNTFGNVSIEEIVFNLKVPMTGVNTDYVYDFIRQCLVKTILWCIVLGVCIYIYNLLLDKFVSKKALKIIGKSMPWLGTLAIMVVSIWYTSQKFDIKEYLINEVKATTFIEDNYVDASDVEIKFPEKKRNLIYIYLESMEYTFGLNENGGAYDIDLIPELNTLAKENVNFSNNNLVGGPVPTYGSTWTIGALVTQTTGVPVKIPVYNPTLNEYSSFLPGATTLGDILYENGYNNYLMIGSDAAYAGRSNYFSQHGNYEIWDHNTAIEKGKIPEGYSVWWGYEDSKLFDYAKEQLSDISKSDEPFNFTMLTADTHFEDGYLCEDCGNEFGDNKYANVIACSSTRVNEFINWIKEQDFYENTSIVISGDHITMDMDFAENVPDTYQRGVYNAFINTPFDNSTSKNRKITTMDMFPTTLASLGVEIEGNKLGLGTNLFSKEQTLLEEMNGDIESLNNELKSKSRFYDNQFMYGTRKVNN